MPSGSPSMRRAASWCGWVALISPSPPPPSTPEAERANSR